MKKLIYILTIPAVAIFLATSCENLNTYPVFDDANAFVSFQETAISLSEEAGTVEIPVALSSVEGISTTITYEVVDSTAIAGVNYTVPEDNTLTFSADQRIDTISIQITDLDGEYTGDLVFKVVFSNTGSVTDGAANECVVTIQDADHPLNYILGDYTATSANGSTWTMTLSKDDSDDTMVWFYNIGNLGSYADGALYYGVVNTETNTISIPLGQESESTYSADGYFTDTPITLCVTDGYGVYSSGYITGTITEDGANIELASEGMTGIMPAFLYGDNSAMYLSWEDFPIVLTK